MLFKAKKCEHCQKEVDEGYDICPHCLEVFPNRNGLKYANKLMWFPFPIQLTFALIGLFGLILFNIFFEFVFATYYQTNRVFYVTMVNFASYLTLFVCFAVILFFDRKYRYYAIQFNQLKPYLFGLLFGAVLITSSIVYSLIISCFYQAETGGNESTMRLMMANYPAITFFISVLFGPICEEITYRLGMFTFLSRISRYLAYAVTIIVFGFIHFDFTSSNIVNEFVNLPSYMIAGFILCFTYEKFGIAGSLSAHMANNLVSFVLSMIV